MAELLNRALIDRPRHPERVAQFGGGNFLRGFVDWTIDILNDEAGFDSGVALIKATPGSYPELDAQDCLFTTCLRGIREGELLEETRLISAVNRTLYPHADFDGYLALARGDDLRFIFSNTTEAGIVFSPDDQFSDAPPATFPAKLTRFLHERFRHFHGADDRGCIIIPTELIPDNATRLRELILRYAKLWGLEAAFSDWIENHNLFCNTLVDRIIPGFPAADAERLFADLGYEDQLLVAGEIYHSWIIEAPPSLLDEFPVDRSRTPLNIKIVADAAPYRRIKVRLLNGAHTSMVPLGLLLGIDSVRDAVEHERLGPFLRKLIFDEVIPSVGDIPQDELETFAVDVFDRFRNPHIHHRLLTISLNSASKVKERILPSILGYHAKRGELPQRLTLALAAFIRLYQGQWRGESIPLNDDPAILAWFKEAWATAENADDLAEMVLRNADLWDSDMTQVPGLSERVAVCLRLIEEDRLLELL